MSALGITVLKNNVPWGPFTRAQIEHGLNRGDFTAKYLAHAPGLTEWLPLGEVIEFVDRSAGPNAPTLPPVPEARLLPPVPEPPTRIESGAPVVTKPAPAPPILPPPVQRMAEKPAPLSAPVFPAGDISSKQEAMPEVDLTPASFFLRGIAFVIDCCILFLPVLILYVLGALAIEIPAAWHHIAHQTRMDEWTHLEQNTWRLLVLVAVGFGWLYGAGLESSRSQATVGKRWMGIKVTDVQGDRLSFVRATGRYAAKYLSALPFFLGFIAALFSSRRLAMHDRLSGTRVVKK
jgi:uncharacterized RDD family membrane protein YckC